MDHESYMRMALHQARLAWQRDEVPVGAIVVAENRVVGRGYNQSVWRTDPSAHAEIVALRRAAKVLGNYRLTSATLYCTLEPCAMCLGAMVLARVKALVYGTPDPKAGVVESHLNLIESGIFNHRIQVHSGVLQAHCSRLLKGFFQSKRS
ncbi:MAG: tRNA adenosine(34) deaminase TadA [Acidobacteriota bacterium]